ncbi:hypothetical protein AB1K54_06200 [Microbacterium sp. BWT-B31]|uniref:hypothetical protein n=1 Tax=Microbacterium sp. BWT-B31 TaxID=3232072 RepID=UPI00352909AA
MQGSAAIMERVEAFGAEVVEASAWAFAAGLRRAGLAAGSVEAVGVADVVEVALAADGVDGVVDLVLAGPAMGGLGERDVERLVAVVDERAAREAVAA